MMLTPGIVGQPTKKWALFYFFQDRSQKPYLSNNDLPVVEVTKAVLAWEARPSMLEWIHAAKL